MWILKCNVLELIFSMALVFLRNLNLAYIILFSYFYLFQNGQIDLLTPTKELRGSHFLSKIRCFALKVKFRFPKLQTNFLKNALFVWSSIFSLLMFISLSWYLHFRYILLFYVLTLFYHLSFGHKSMRVLKTFRSSHLKPVTRTSGSPTIFPNT